MVRVNRYHLVKQRNSQWPSDCDGLRRGMRRLHDEFQLMFGDLRAWRTPAHRVPAFQRAVDFRWDRCVLRATKLGVQQRWLARRCSCCPQTAGRQRRCLTLRWETQGRRETILGTFASIGPLVGACQRVGCVCCFALERASPNGGSALAEVGPGMLQRRHPSKVRDVSKESGVAAGCGRGPPSGTGRGPTPGRSLPRATRTAGGVG